MDGVQGCNLHIFEYEIIPVEGMGTTLSSLLEFLVSMVLHLLIIFHFMVYFEFFSPGFYFVRLGVCLFRNEIMVIEVLNVFRLFLGKH